MIKMISDSILKKLSNNICKSEIFAVLTHSTKEINGKEQERICTRQRAKRPRTNVKHEFILALKTFA